MFRRFRERLALLIFPEFDEYMDIAIRLGKAEENHNCIEKLRKSDSPCAEWAVSQIETKTTSWSVVKDMFNE